MAQKGARWLHNPYRLGVPYASEWGKQSEVPTSGPGGYITPAAWGLPNASERGKLSQVAHKWAGWLQNPCCLGGSQRFTTGETITSGNNQKWPTSGPGGYITPTAWGGPQRFRAVKTITSGNNRQWPKKGPGGYITPTAWGSSTLQSGGNNHKRKQSAVAQKGARWLHNPYRLGVPYASEWGKQSEVPTSGPGGYITPTARGSPTLHSGGNNHKRKQSAVAQKGARWLHNPYRLGVPYASEWGKQSEVPTSGPGGYITPAAWGLPNASERGKLSQVAHKWAGWLQNPCCLGGSQRFTTGETITSGNNQKWPTSGPGGYITPTDRGSPTLPSGGNNHRWPTSGPGGYITPTAREHSWSVAYSTSRKPILAWGPSLPFVARPTPR